MKELDAFIDARRDQDFAYFERDCATLAADWVQLRTGADPLASLRLDGGPLASRRLLTALRHVRAHGGLHAAAVELLGPALPGLMACRGDIVLMRSGGRLGLVSGHAFGICTGQNLVAPGKDRLTFLGLTAGVAAWRV
ncbi:DUF6950 family protein [Pseudacidovorax intermedius]|uniref:DUF6950 domain-containing protein n=1 Tax=Pseudacidovorax intermedius TaxID=433924 RepID=A0A147GW91_9BURK|nr:hypothetical protein [Pseudacidovorax intermedius]KTT21905.1 hypothetical protein NS331_11130 [Pseudacidovorax intermedius]